LFKINAKGTMSSWLPSFVYQLPFIKLKTKTDYLMAQEIIRKKHHL